MSEGDTRPPWKVGSSLAKTLLVVLLLLGISLLLRQYLSNRALQVDEAALAHSILAQPWSGFDVPLPFGDQMAPVGFQWIVKGLARVFGDGELVLRLWPLCAAVLALFAFAAASHQYLPPSAALVTMALLAFNERSIFYGSELKQYSSDLLGAALLLLLAGRIQAQGLDSRGAALRVGLVSAACCWLSFTSFFVLAGLAAVLAWSLFSERRTKDLHRGALAAAVAVVLSAPAALAAVWQVPPGNRAWLLKFWDKGVPPEGAGILGVLRWSLAAVRAEVAYLFQFRPNEANLLFLLAVLLGVLSTTWLHRRYGLLAVSVIAAALLAGAAKTYPFSRRLVLFLIPSFLLLCGQGLTLLWRGRERALRIVGVALAGYLVAVTAWGTVRAIPLSRVELRSVMETIRAEAKPQDAMYVHYEAFHAFQYYQPRLRVPLDRVVYGRCRRDQWQYYVDDLRKLLGRDRVWILYSQMGEMPEVDFLQATLDSLGPRLREIRAPRALAVLYDLRAARPADLDRALESIPPEHRSAEPAMICRLGPYRDSGVTK